ncbi:peptidoglycan D,D-transpeptidase FtsI family protein [Candidatus Contubernalis alkaliaceticus]|uniref:peptidoglycan D,D-transpeptidase FtsI family protein n=1 Tax=Candidatus Contubernalis alkaliaceticus TaxID=338645 RepID=UPI001F4C41C2|nr:penicillin-binding protein 2 [Candidatus Contubernalis alkalaceticus]UNC92583.1 penicillin-binding protein 2 [Candidatus Contubernalis alkalaceticus]
MGRLYRQKRIALLLLMFLISCMLLILKLFSIQIWQAQNLTTEAISQRMASYQLDDGRGNILDREGVPLTGHTREILIAFPFLIQDTSEVKEALGGIFNSSELIEIENIIKSTSDKKAVCAAPGKGIQLTREQARKIKELNIPGIVLAQEKERYGKEPLAVHLIGQLRSEVGVSGIEGIFENELKARSPEMISVFLDGRDRILQGLGYRYIPSEKNLAPLDVKLTLDYSIQKLVEEKMDKYINRGAVVVMDPRNGDILAMASRPQPDSNIDGSYLNHNLENYHPASVFKLVVAAAALEKGYYQINDKFTCGGQIEAGAHTFNCFHGPHGEVSMSQALAHSCNSAFIEMGLEIGGDSIIEYAVKMGLGERTGLYPSPHENWESNYGSMPSYEELLSPAGIANAVLGHYQVKATPLQVAQLLAIIANDGKLVSPRVVMELTTSKGVTVQRFNWDKGRTVLLPSTVKQIKLMMAGVTRFGTGQAAAVEGYATAGKTGTVQAGGSWFAGFTPVEFPTAVIVVFIDESKGHGYNAAYVYGKIMGEILGRG